MVGAEGALFTRWVAFDGELTGLGGASVPLHVAQLLGLLKDDVDGRELVSRGEPEDGLGCCRFRGHRNRCFWNRRMEMQQQKFSREFKLGW